METFTWAADWGIAQTAEPTTYKVSFGDGYEQRGAKGLNADLRTYELAFTGTVEKINAIDNFLKDKAGYKAFNWTPYAENGGIFKCETWKKSYKTGYLTLTATFKEVVA